MSEQMAVPPAELWGLVSSPGHLEECHPFCAANKVERWPGEESCDTIEYHNGRIVRRRFTAWLEEQGYDLEVTDDNGLLAEVSWRISGRETGSELTIGLTPHTFRSVPRLVRWIPHLLFARPLFRRYLRSVVAGIRFRAETGQPVAPNQFGRHVWFS